jgi:hypothetical protein
LKLPNQSHVPMSAGLVWSKNWNWQNFNTLAYLTPQSGRNLIHYRLRRFPEVILQHPSETLLALDRVVLVRRR